MTDFQTTYSFNTSSQPTPPLPESSDRMAADLAGLADELAYSRRHYLERRRREMRELRQVREMTERVDD
jgi:hypothetical protein